MFSQIGLMMPTIWHMEHSKFNHTGAGIFLPYSFQSVSANCEPYVLVFSEKAIAPNNVHKSSHTNILFILSIRSILFCSQPERSGNNKKNTLVMDSAPYNTFSDGNILVRSSITNYLLVVRLKNRNQDISVLCLFRNTGE